MNEKVAKNKMGLLQNIKLTINSIFLIVHTNNTVYHKAMCFAAASYT